jgi:diadenosine tetraphosphate (Ap4A) HIT family hydrolase
MNETMQTFGYPDSLIKEYQHWVLLLRPKQVTLGSLVIATNSQKRHLGEISSEQWGEFAIVASDAEKITTKLFGAEKFNYLALMMKDPNVHFHFVPRYSTNVVFHGQTFTDKDWPLKTELTPINVSEVVLDALQDKLKQAILS